MTKRAEEEKTFETYDVYISAFLSLSGITPKLKKINDFKVVFCFSVSDGLFRLISDYNGNINIPIGDLVTEIKKLRGQMLSMRGQR